jgi:hypothetical protein
MLQQVERLESYVLIGDAHPHGVMHGEMLDPKWSLKVGTVAIQ